MNQNLEIQDTVKFYKNSDSLLFVMYKIFNNSYFITTSMSLFCKKYLKSNMCKVTRFLKIFKDFNISV